MDRAGLYQCLSLEGISTNLYLPPHVGIEFPSRKLRNDMNHYHQRAEIARLVYRLGLVAFITAAICVLPLIVSTADELFLGLLGLTALVIVAVPALL